MKDFIDLKPCPFCGGKAYIVDGGKDYSFFAGCSNCCSYTEFFKTKDEALAAWNTRPVEDAQASEIKRLRESLEKIIDRAENEESKASNATYGFAYDIEYIARDALVKANNTPSTIN